MCCANLAGSDFTQCFEVRIMTQIIAEPNEITPNKDHSAVDVGNSFGNWSDPVRSPFAASSSLKIASRLLDSHTTWSDFLGSTPTGLSDNRTRIAPGSHTGIQRPQIVSERLAWCGRKTSRNLQPRLQGESSTFPMNLLVLRDIRIHKSVASKVSIADTRRCYASRSS
jgi:hypothetical protein